MTHTKKKKKPRPPSKTGTKIGKANGEEKKEAEEQKIVNALMEAFSLSSIEEAVSAYRESNGDADKAAEILAGLVDIAEDPSSSCSTSSWVGSTSGSTSGSYEGSMELNCALDTKNMKGFRRNKQKRVIAATGTVSTVIGKEYVPSTPKKINSMKPKGFGGGVFGKEEAEQFLFSMLGYNSELSMAVVKDVLCQCQYDIERALDVLLDLSSTFNSSRNHSNFNDGINSTEDSDNLADKVSDSTSHSSESELMDSIWSIGYGLHGNNFRVPSSSEVRSPTKSTLPQKVLEILFNITESPEREPSTMNWRNVVKKMELLGNGFDAHSSDITEIQEETHAKGDEYHVFRQTSKQHWESMRSNYQKAATAFSKGEKGYAAYLSDQGRSQTTMAREADEKASYNIFKARNRNIENVITIDLHGQHVKQAMKLLKMHLLFGAYLPSVRTLRIITGCGAQGLGKSLLKQSVVKLLEKESIKWIEENRGTVLIKLDGQKNFTFLESDNDTE